jgi:hypothetical protein
LASPLFLYSGLPWPDLIITGSAVHCASARSLLPYKTTEKSVEDIRKRIRIVSDGKCPQIRVYPRFYPDTKPDRNEMLLTAFLFVSIVEWM